MPLGPRVPPNLPAIALGTVILALGTVILAVRGQLFPGPATRAG
jgi:hypothetical protein